MKARATILLALVVSLALVPVLASVPVHAQNQYSERLDVYTAGQAGFWSVSMNEVATNSSLLNAIDSTTGLTSYRLVAMSTQGVTSDLQVFGVNGYNLLDIPTQPPQGLFLTVNATSASAASSVASDLDRLFGTTFSAVGLSTSSSWSFYAPVDFVNVATPVLYKLVPSAQAGFAASVPRSTLATVVMPFMVLTGTSSGGAFDHTIAVGGATANVLNSAKGINLASLVGSTNATMTATTSSSTSQVVVHSLDGVIVSTDTATVVNHISNFSGSYSLSVGSGKQVKVNATIETQPPTAVAYRLVDHGSLSANQTVGITIVVANTAKSGGISNVTMSDNWWQALPADFQLVSGNYSFTIPSIAAGQNVTETYVLKVLSSTAAQVTIPPATVTFGYLLSTGAFTGHATLGKQFLQLNQLAPALNVQVRSSILSGSALGTVGKYLVTITNTGNSPALNVRLNNYTVSGSIAEGGGSATLSIPISLNGLAQRNLTKVFSIEFANTDGVSQNITANTVPLMLSHASMVIPFVQVVTNDTLTAQTMAAKALTVTYTFANTGKGSPSRVIATDVFPQGVGCTVRSGIGNCTGGGYSMTTGTLTTQRNNLNVTFGADNYFIAATAVLSSYEGMEFHSYGGSYIIPAGLSVSKSFSPKAGFPGSSSTVTIGVANVGTQPLFNATLTSSADSFDTASSSAGANSKTYAELGPSSNFTFNYPVTLSTGAYGNLTSGAVITSFLFAGSVQTLSLGQSSLVVYRPVTATIHSSPSSPQENHEFTLTVTLSNSAGVSVTNVVYTLAIPSGVTVVSGATVSNHQVTITIPSMQANSDQNVSLRLSANTGLTIDTSSSHLTFQYAGASLQGIVTAGKVAVNVDSTTRYTIPIAVAVIAALVAVVYVRRKVGPAAIP